MNGTTLNLTGLVASRWMISFVAVIALAASPAAAQLNQTMHYDGWILAAAHAPGLHGSTWRTDLWVNRDTSGVNDVRLVFCESGADNSAASEHVLDFGWPGNQVVYIEDVVDSFLDVGNGTWVGAIHYSADLPVQVWARIYSIDADGTASYGQLVEGIPTADMSLDDDPWDTRDQQYLMAVKHTADDRFRVNIGIVNPTGIEARYYARAYDMSGNCPPSGCMAFEVTVPPYSMIQQSDPFAAWQGGDWDAAIIQIKCTTDGAGGFAYASVVDNATNDAFFVRGVKKKLPSD